MALIDEVPDDSPPFGSRQLSTEEQLERYTEIRGEPQAWAKLLDAHGLKEVGAYAQRMEPLHQERLLNQQKEDKRISAWSEE